MRKKVKVGNVTLGGGGVYIQTMLKKSARDIEGSIKQALELQEAGCEIIRAAVPEVRDVGLIYALKERLSIPVVADIHFDHNIALEAVKAGADKIRLNPGNLEPDKIEAVARECKKRGIPIRIGINAGSIEKEILQKHGVCAEALVESALRSAKLLEEIGFNDIILSVKASSVKMTIDAYRLLHKKCDYPLHIGVTEAGTKRIGILKSAAGIGSLLCDGIGDTIRVSLTDEPLEEIYAARDLLTALGLGKTPEIISCPTCGRTKTDIIKLVGEVEKLAAGIKKPLKIAVMGCVVNGPGEAREADIGIAFGGGDSGGVLFRKGEIVAKVSEDKILEVLKKEIEGLL
ncbi:MAG: flavodoxin-dependent (E)-4-hydroxy-3-methylbut-2-enyl-diphosphate synthase [Oscillospiraceae bacterium]|jgi:(E)-4-hydroxy-3-methylbut-2-enyl-diphosphate synthase|nr:flavodoxin-dependent (E)-4-hydroxy-3-methylbut-2-enyl-diphosphate synthase [Oscillospiraceae bacterium]